MGVLNVVIGVIVLIVAVWVAIFGGIGALLSSSRGASRASGLAWGTLLGPIGWVAILWLTRGSTRATESVAPLAAESTWTTDSWDD